MAPRRETVVELIDEMSLLLRAARLMAQRSTARVDLPAPLVGVLWTLYSHGALRQNQLADRLHQRIRAGVGRSRSAGDGLIERTRSEDDGRVSSSRSARRQGPANAALEHRADDYAPKFTDWSDDQARDVLATIVTPGARSPTTLTLPLVPAM